MVARASWRTSVWYCRGPRASRLGPGIFAAWSSSPAAGSPPAGEWPRGRSGAGRGLGEMVLDALVLLTPLLPCCSRGPARPFALGGWTFAASLLAFKLERLDPVKGLARVFSLNGLVESPRPWPSSWCWPGPPSSCCGPTRGGAEPRPGAAARGTRSAGALLNHALIVLCGALALVAAVDVPYQVWQHASGSG